MPFVHSMMPDTRISKYSALLIIVVAAFLIHGSVLGRFWLADDPQVLLHAVRYGPLEVVSERAAWQELSTSNFTPVVTWSFDLDLALFGPEPVWFYLHQILSLALTALALRWLMLAIGLPRRESLVVALLFLAMPPTVHVAGLLMTRHYVEGLLASVVAVLLWVVADRSERPGRALIAASVAAYLIALLSKEVFILLPLIFVALSRGGPGQWRRVVRRLAPFGAVLLAFLGWRSWMLGGSGGYGSGNMLLHFFGVTLQWARSEPLIASWFGVMVAICAGSWLRSRSELIRFMLIALAAVGPLAGIGDSLEGRHLLLPAVVLMCGTIAGITWRAGKYWSSLSFSLFVLLTLVSAVFALFRESDAVRRMEAEGRYVWVRTHDATPLLAGSPAWYLDGVAELDHLWRGETSPEVAYSEIGVLLTAETESYVYYREDGLSSTSYLEDILSLADGYLPDAPLSIEIERKDHALRWRLGPQCECTWRFYSYPGYQGYDVPQEGMRVVPRPRAQQWFRIERRHASGQWTLTPPLPLPREGETTAWKRGE